MRGEAEKSCINYYRHHGYKVVRGGFFLMVCQHHQQSHEQLSFRERFYLAIQMNQMADADLPMGSLGQEVRKARQALKRLPLLRQQALSELAKQWPHPIHFSGAPDFFVYAPHDPQHHFFVEAKGRTDKIKPSQRKAARYITSKGFPIFLYRLSSRGRNIVAFAS